ncbi:heavy metal transporter [Flavobacterium cyanobacteriorum]|uniref:Heavy metal transporter n=1 Tax=Flavobacterium cyanobacteriorum TaxID=2022802 RepID=A0A255ZAT8_9FLAO|nr:heavy metal-associated domain-containing protein [Flavobacterium cyanobacteriorum]OYQ37975.1 heavy metal transporter [Flavobacterium cyanobacteriorum]
MTHTYKITGMTCDGCVAKVSHLLGLVPGVTGVDVNLDAGEASISMEKNIATPILQQAMRDYPKYGLSEKKYPGEMNELSDKTNVFESNNAGITTETRKSWAATYRPILVIAGYITLVSLLVSFTVNGFSGMLFMRTFMSGFFLTFSFFKMLDLRGFADSYAMYDIIAMKFRGWGYVYAFLELSLGIAFAINFEPLLTNAFTAVLMSVSLVGVLQSVLNQKKIRCACLGAVFNLPMSTVTIIEDGLMIAMSVAMLLMYL